MEPQRFLAGTVAGAFALLAPVQGLIVCAVIFVAIDFATGVVASRCRARRAGRQWRFSSRRAWDTALKLVMVMAGIVLAWLLDGVVSPLVEMHLARLFTGFVCGVEFWSYLENAADITGQPLFRTLRRLLKRHFDKHRPNPE
jgi:phage-related holin